MSFGSSKFLKSLRNEGYNQLRPDVLGSDSQDLYDLMSRFTTISELKRVSPGIPFSLVHHRRLWVSVSSSGPGKSDVERDRLLRYIGSGEGGNVRWRLAGREKFFNEVLFLRFVGASLAEAVRGLLTSRGTSEGPAVWTGRLARRVVTTTGDVVDAPDLEPLDWEKKPRSEDDLVLGEDNIRVTRQLQIETSISPKSRAFYLAQQHGNVVTNILLYCTFYVKMHDRCRMYTPV